jgi:hypothetical protein
VRRQRDVISTLHISNGDSVTGTLPRAGVAGNTSIWADALHDGPVPGGISDDELLQLRAAFIADGLPLTTEQVAAGLREWRDAIDRSRNYDEVVLWFEHDLFDQLNLIQLLDRLQYMRHPRATMICIGAFPGHHRFKGLGELKPEELASLLPSRLPITADQYAVASHAWKAFRSSDPSAVPHLLETDTSALPFLAPALRRFLEEFPAPNDGLSRTERHLLQLVSAQPMTAHEIFPRMHDGEDAYYMTDTGLGSLLRDLATTTPPLIETDLRAEEERKPEGDRKPEGFRLPKARVSITAAGLDVLQGRANRVVLCGLDRWYGGVHLVQRRGA